MKQSAIQLSLIFCLIPGIILSQYPCGSFGPGFSAAECDDMLHINAAFTDTTPGNRFEGFIEDYRFFYRSGSIGLDNTWDLWLGKDSTLVIALRGTTADPKSIAADFFCAMVPAKGRLVLTPGDTMSYQLAAEPRAAVHAGFLTGFAFIARDISPKLDSLYRLGYHQVLVTGHSQGGSLCYYISAWLHYLRINQVYPELKVKTYASAPTKTGNMYFAYDYDNITRSEWSFSIINSADPVPELPFTTQQVDRDMNEPNPILNMYKQFNKLPFFQRIALKHAFNKMRKKAAKSSEAYQKYLGGYAQKVITKMIPGVAIPEHMNTSYFVRPGVPVSLMVNDAYQKYFASNNGPYFHHSITAYRFLLRQYYEGLAPLVE